MEGSRAIGSSGEYLDLWGFWEVFGDFGGLWGIWGTSEVFWRCLGDLRGVLGGSGESLRCFGGSQEFWESLGMLVSLRVLGSLGCFGGSPGVPAPLTPLPAVCVLYTQRPGSHQWREVSDPIGGRQPISMLGCAQLANRHVRMHSVSQSGYWGASWPTNHQHIAAMTYQHVCVPARWPISMSEVIAASQPNSM